MTNANGLAAMEQHRVYLTMVARLLLPARLRSMLDPEDLVQQTLIEASQVSAVATMAYLRTALRNNILDALRKGGEAAREMVSIDQSSARLEAWLAADQSSPSARAARNEDLAHLADAVASLPEEQRKAVEYKHLQGCAVAEIAQRMGRSEAAVGCLLRRGLATLRHLLTPKE